MKKKIIIAVLCVLLCSISVVSVVTANAATFVTDSEWKLEIASDTEYYIEKYLGSSANLTLPEQIGTHKVVKINSKAFSDAPVVELIIPDSYTFIDNNAFLGNETITSVTLPASVNQMGVSVFANCTALKAVNFAEPALFESITASYFSGCSSIEEITLPHGIKNIYNYAFLNCSSLTKLVIPASVDYIASKAFNKCDNVTLYVYDGSYALEYAINNSIPYVSLGAYVEPTEPTTATESATADATEVTSSTTIIESSTATDATESTTATVVTTEPYESTPSTEVTGSTATDGSSTATDATEPQSSSADVSSTATEPSTALNSSSSPASSTESTVVGLLTYYIGDADLDYRITIKDATIIQKHVAKLITLNNVQTILADVNVDENVSVKDATQIQKFIAGFKDILYVGNEVKL